MGKKSKKNRKKMANGHLQREVQDIFLPILIMSSNKSILLAMFFSCCLVS